MEWLDIISKDLDDMQPTIIDGFLDYYNKEIIIPDERSLLSMRSILENAWVSAFENTNKSIISSNAIMPHSNEEIVFFIAIEIELEKVEQYMIPGDLFKFNFNKSLIEANIINYYEKLKREDLPLDYKLNEIDLNKINIEAGREFIEIVRYATMRDDDFPDMLTNRDYENFKLGFELYKYKKDNEEDKLAYNIEKISGLDYEKSEVHGKIILMKEVIFNDIANINKGLILFKNIYQLTQHKMIRKLLQICDDDVALIINNEGAIGLCNDGIIKEIENNVNVYFIVEFKKKNHFDLYLFTKFEKRQRLLSYDNKNYMLTSEIAINKKVGDLTKILKFKGFSNVERIVNIVIEAAKQEHGAMIIFTKDIESVVDHFSNASIPLYVPIDLHDNISFAKLLGSIDGAIICDEHGYCYSIGVILDGITNSKSDSKENISRGARYNSAQRYQHSNNECVIVVISEDGDIDVIPGDVQTQ